MKEGVKVDGNLSNTILHTLGKRGETKELLRHFDSMKEQNLADRYTYSIVLDSLGKLSWLRKKLEILSGFLTEFTSFWLLW